MAKNTIKSITLIGNDFCPEEIANIKGYLEQLEPSPRLALIEPEQGRKNLLEGLKQLALRSQEISEADILELEFQPDLIVKVGDKNSSLENSLIVGASYAEIAFCQTETSKFNLANLQTIIQDFEQRKRNFGA